MNRAWLSASSPGSRAVTSSRGNLDSSATPLKVFCPCTATLYPSASKGSRGKASSTHLVSCRTTMSGRRSASQAVRLSILCLMELTFQVAMRICGEIWCKIVRCKPAGTPAPDDRVLTRGYTVFTTTPHRGMLEGCPRVLKESYERGTGKERESGWADGGPARRSNEEADIGGGGGGGAGRSRLCPRRYAQRLMAGWRGRAGSPTERVPRGAGRNRDRREESRSRPHRGAWNGDTDRQRRGQAARGQRNHRRALPRRRNGQSRRPPVHARQPHDRSASEAGRRLARRGKSEPRAGGTRRRALHRTSRQERDHAGHAAKRAHAGQHLALLGRFQHCATRESQHPD